MLLGCRATEWTTSEISARSPKPSGSPPPPYRRRSGRTDRTSGYRRDSVWTEGLQGGLFDERATSESGISVHFGLRIRRSGSQIIREADGFWFLDDFGLRMRHLPRWPSRNQYRVLARADAGDGAQDAIIGSSPALLD